MSVLLRRIGLLRDDENHSVAAGLLHKALGGANLQVYADHIDVYDDGHWHAVEPNDGDTIEHALEIVLDAMRDLSYVVVNDENLCARPGGAPTPPPDGVRSSMLFTCPEGAAPRLKYLRIYMADDRVELHSLYGAIQFRPEAGQDVVDVYAEQFVKLMEAGYSHCKEVEYQPELWAEPQEDGWEPGG